MTQPQIEGFQVSGVNYRGARVGLSVAGYAVSVDVRSTVPWAVEAFDTDSIWSAGTPSRLTVPSGVTLIKLRAYGAWTHEPTGVRTLRFLKNGLPDHGVGLLKLEKWTDYVSPTTAEGGINFATLDLFSPVLEVVSTDYFEVEVGVIDAGGWSNGIDLFERGSYFEMEIIE